MKYAIIKNNAISEICPGNPQDYFTPEVAEQYDTLVPDDARINQGWVDGKLIELKPKTIDNNTVRSALSLKQKVLWDNNSLPEIVTVKIEFSEARTVTEAEKILKLLVECEFILPSTMYEILAE